MSYFLARKRGGTPPVDIIRCFNLKYKHIVHLRKVFEKILLECFKIHQGMKIFNYKAQEVQLMMRFNLKVTILLEHIYNHNIEQILISIC